MYLYFYQTCHLDKKQPPKVNKEKNKDKFYSFIYVEIRKKYITCKYYSYHNEPIHRESVFLQGNEGDL